MHKDNIILIIGFVGFFMAILISGFIVVVLKLYQKKEETHRRELELARVQFNEELWQSKFDIQEQTIQHISRELHDNIGQYMTVVKSQLYRMEVTGKAKEQRDTCLELVTNCITDLRDVSKSLSLELIKINGLPFAINKLIEQLRKISGFEIRFETLGNYTFQDETREIIMFRLLQEALSNIVKHAGATLIDVRLDCTVAELIKLVITDNGNGFPAETSISGSDGYATGGVRHMVNRTKMIDGEILIESTPGRGTVVAITVPFKSAIALKNEEDNYWVS